MPRYIQQQLFNRPTFNVIKTQKEAMNTAARDCGLSRSEIVDKMNDLAERYGIKLVSGNSHGLQIDTLEWANSKLRIRKENKTIRTIEPELFEEI
jgi:ribonuclease HIII